MSPNKKTTHTHTSINVGHLERWTKMDVYNLSDTIPFHSLAPFQYTNAHSEKMSFVSLSRLDVPFTSSINLN